MRLTINVAGIKEAAASLQGFSQRRLASVAAAGLNRTAREIAAAEKREMETKLDRPKPYTLGGVGVKLANVGDLQVEVFLKTEGGSGRGAGKYLQAQVEGGRRERKGFEVMLQAVGIMPQGMRAVPAPAARMDPFGNMERQQLTQIINQLKAHNIGPQPRGFTRRAIGAARRAGGQFFVIQPGTKAAPGVYIREFGGRDITAVLLFVSTSQYRKRLDFYGVARTVAERRLVTHVGDAFRESVARLVGGRT